MVEAKENEPREYELNYTLDFDTHLVEGAVAAFNPQSKLFIVDLLTMDSRFFAKGGQIIGLKASTVVQSRLIVPPEVFRDVVNSLKGQLDQYDANQKAQKAV